MRLFIAFVLMLVAAGPVHADPAAQSLCTQYNLTNVDCACVSKRYDGYMEAAQTRQYQSIVEASYRHALGAENDYLEKLSAMQQDLQMIMRYQQRFESISGGEPGNLDDFFAGCAIEGAPLTPLPALSSEPIHQKLYAACMEFYPDARNCQCQTAQIQDAASVSEAKAYYYSFNEKGNGTYEEEQSFSARKAGLSLEDFKAADRRARSKIGSDNYKGPVNCGVLRWADGRDGRSAQQRAGVPKGFENYKQSDDVDPMASIQRAQAEAAAFAQGQAAQMDGGQIKALIASAQAEQAAYNKQLAADKARGAQLTQQSTPRGLLDKGCASADTDPPVCQCLGGVFESAVASSNASKGAATQLALLMTGGEMDGEDAAAMMKSASPADLAAATQMFGANMMSIMNCQ